MLPRVGYGYDLHRLEAGHRLIVGGVELSRDIGTVAHSDGDVVCHAVTDAVLGALGQGDIGEVFPDDDPKWQKADSQVFVAEAVRRISDAAFTLGNLDVTIILQQPKLAPHKSAVADNLTRMFGCEREQINVKGKTNERVGPVGRQEAIAAHAVVLLTPGEG